MYLHIYTAYREPSLVITCGSSSAASGPRSKEHHYAGRRVTSCQAAQLYGTSLQKYTRSFRKALLTKATEPVPIHLPSCLPLPPYSSIFTHHQKSNKTNLIDRHHHSIKIDN